MIYSTAFATVAALGSMRGARIGGSPSLAANAVHSTARSQRVDLEALRRYGEGLGGAIIAFAGVAFWLWPAP